MGNSSGKGLVYSSNDYQLAIEASKELEYLLEKEFGAYGQGLHERVTSVEKSLPLPTVRNMRYIATLRNQLIHNREMRALPDRAKFISRFDAAVAELNTLIDKKGLDARRAEPVAAPGCVIS